MRRDLLACLVLIPLLSACGEQPQPTPAAQQAAAQPLTPEQERQKYCKAMAWSQLGTPGGMSAVGAFYANCMNGVPVQQPQQQRPVQTRCRQSPIGTITCESY